MNIENDMKSENYNSFTSNGDLINLTNKIENYQK